MKDRFPLIAAALGLVLMLVVFKGSAVRDDGRTVLPMLTLLLVSEFTCILNAVGAYLGIQRLRSTGFTPAVMLAVLCCSLLAIGALVRGIQLWPL